MTAAESEIVIRDLRLDPIIRSHVESVIRQVGGHRSAARELGIGRTTLYRWLKRWEREDEEDAEDAAAAKRGPDHVEAH